MAEASLNAAEGAILQAQYFTLIEVEFVAVLNALPDKGEFVLICGIFL